MSIHEKGMRVRGRLVAQLIHVKTGKVVQQEVVENLVTDIGEQMLAYLIEGDTATKGYVTHMSLCDSSTAAAETDTTEVGTNNGPRKAVSGVTVTGGMVHFEGQWGTGEANYTIRRSYLFTAASGGNLFATAAFTTPFTKTSDYTFKATWEETFEQP